MASEFSESHVPSEEEAKLHAKVQEAFGNKIGSCTLFPNFQIGISRTGELWFQEDCMDWNTYPETAQHLIKYFQNKYAINSGEAEFLFTLVDVYNDIDYEGDEPTAKQWIEYFDTLDHEKVMALFEKDRQLEDARHAAMEVDAAELSGGRPLATGAAIIAAATVIGAIAGCPPKHKTPPTPPAKNLSAEPIPQPKPFVSNTPAGTALGRLEVKAATPTPAAQRR